MSLTILDFSKTHAMKQSKLFNSLSGFSLNAVLSATRRSSCNIWSIIVNRSIKIIKKQSSSFLLK